MKTGVEAVDWMFASIVSGDTSEAETHLAWNYLNRESIDDGRSERRGPQEFRETTEWLRSAFSDLNFEVVDVIACADRVVVLAYMTGKHTSPFLGLPATHRSFRQRQVHLFWLDEEARVSEHLAQRDDLGLRRQLTA